MSTTADQEPRRHFRETQASETDAVAEQLVALVEEFEAVLSEGHVPPAFAERLAQLRRTAKTLI